LDTIWFGQRGSQSITSGGGVGSGSARAASPYSSTGMYQMPPLRYLLTEQLLTDCVIKVCGNDGVVECYTFVIQVGNRLINAHRCILSLHSSVFRQMFTNEHMSEAIDGIVNISDAYYEPVCVCMLLFSFISI
jgi:hypothetical protein